MSSITPPPTEHGFTIRGLVSTLDPSYAVVLLAPNSAAAATRAMRPVAAYLFRRPAAPHSGQWTFLAQTLLRGADVSGWELRHFCALTRRVAADLLPRACRR